MPSKRKVLKINDGFTQLGGTDVGKYPVHHFNHNFLFESQTGWPIKLITGGDDEWVSGCSRFRKNSTVFTLEYVQQGNFLFRQNGRENIARPGDVFIVHLGQDTEMSVYKSQYAFKKVLEFTGNALPNIIHSTGLDKFDIITPENSEKMRDMFEQAFKLCRKHTTENMVKSSAIAYEILVDLSRAIVHYDYPDKLRRILSYMEKNIGQGLKLGDICHDCSVSSTGMYNLFMENLKVPPMEYFISFRIEAAKNLLLAGSNYSIKEIANRVGYSNQLYFSTEFKKRVGVSPRAYRLTPKSQVK